MKRVSAFAATMLAAGSTIAAAQDVAIPITNPRVKAALDAIKADNAWTLNQQQSICEIPAPPFIWLICASTSRFTAKPDSYAYGSGLSVVVA